MAESDSRQVYENALRKRVFMLQQCRDCGKFLAPPQAVCEYCGDSDFRWVEACGWGMVLSVTGEPIPGTTYSRHRIALDEGVIISAPVVEPAAEDIRSGMKVYAHIGLLFEEPAVLFVGHEEEDEW